MPLIPLAEGIRALEIQVKGGQLHNAMILNGLLLESIKSMVIPVFATLILINDMLDFFLDFKTTLVDKILVFYLAFGFFHYFIAKNETVFYET